MELKQNNQDSFKVLAYDEKDELVAEYLFAKLQEAIKFQLGMQKKGYTTTMHRLSLWVNTLLFFF